MPLFGAHFSIAGGLHHAAERAQELGCETFQLFTKNASQWKAPPLTDDAITAFRKAVVASKTRHIAAHDSYLINLAAADDVLFEKSVAAFVVEIERAEALGIDYLVTHPGAHVGSGEEAGLNRVIQGLDQAATRTRGFHVQVLLETTAGQGTTLGHRFEHLATLLQGVKEPERFAVCLDTCHIFAAGYPLGTDAEYEETFQQFDAVVGLRHLKLFHINDSVKGLGSRVDRHAGLGLGEIGDSVFKRIVRDPRFANHPMVLETPKEGENDEEMDPVNLKKLRSFTLRANRERKRPENS